MGAVQFHQIKTRLNQAARSLTMIDNQLPDLRKGDLLWYAFALHPRYGRRREHRRIGNDALAAAVPQLQAGDRALCLDRLGKVGEARNHQVIVCTQLGMKSPAAQGIHERKFGDNKARTTARPRAIIFDRLSRDAAIRRGVHGTHRRHDHAVAKSDATQRQGLRKRGKSNRHAANRASALQLESCPPPA